MLRSILAVVVGFFVAMVLSFGTDALLALALPDMVRHDAPTPPAVLVLALAYVFLFSVLGGYVAALLAGRAEIKHGLTLGIIFLALGLVMGLVTVLAPAESMPAGERPPRWYVICCILLALPGPLAGGWLRALQKRRRQAEPNTLA